MGRKQQWSVEEANYLHEIWPSSEGVSSTKLVFERIQREMAVADTTRWLTRLVKEIKDRA